MDDQKQPLRNEPGRRYTAGRIRPRPVMDVRPHVASAPQSHALPEQPLNQVQSKPQQSRTATRTPSTAKPALPRQNRSHVLKRHIVERAVEHRKYVRRTYKRRIAGLLAAFLVIGAILTVIWSFWGASVNFSAISIPLLHHGAHQQKQATVIPVREQSTLEESKPTPDDIRTYQAASDAPAILRISKLGIESRVKRVGASLTGEPISPSNIFDVGWYDDSGKPGQPGAVLINGHELGPTKNGVFHDLETLQPDDQIQIERGDKKVINYVVVRVQAFTGDQVDMNTALDSIDASKNGLNLITSSANYDGGNAQNTRRVIVFAVQQ